MIENIIQRSPSEMSNMSYMELFCLDEVACREHDDRVEKVSVCSEQLEDQRPRPRYYSIKKRKVSWKTKFPKYWVLHFVVMPCIQHHSSIHHPSCILHKSTLANLLRRHAASPEPLRTLDIASRRPSHSGGG